MEQMNRHPTPQEILDREGYLIGASHRKYEVGDILRPPFARPAGIPDDAILVIIGEASKEENRAYCERYFVIPDRGPYFYKMVAE